MNYAQTKGYLLDTINKKVSFFIYAITVWIIHKSFDLMFWTHSKGA